jgi:hypothetical protein
MRFGTRFCFLAAFLFCGANAARASQFFVEPATGSGVPESDLATTTELIRSAVNTTGKHQTVTDADQAEFTLRPRILKLGQAFLLQLDKVEKGKIVFSSELKAEHIEELDKVATRLTQAVLEGKQAPENAKVGQITDQEAHDGTQRKPVRRFTTLGLGAAFFGNLNSSGPGYSFDAGFGWDVNAALIKLFADFSINGGAIFTNLGLEGMLFFSPEDIAPYASADFGLGISRLDPQNTGLNAQVTTGFDVGVGAGVVLLRTSKINLDLGARLNFLLSTNSQGDPFAAVFRVGINF